MNAKQVNQVGKYVYKHLDGAFKVVTHSNTCDVYSTVLYQLPRLKCPIGKWDDIYEMTLCISFTTYANKLRMNVNEVSPNEVTLGHIVVDDSIDVKELPSLIMSKIRKFVMKRYADYDFLY